MSTQAFIFNQFKKSRARKELITAELHQIKIILKLMKKVRTKLLNFIKIQKLILTFNQQYILQTLKKIFQIRNQIKRKKILIK